MASDVNYMTADGVTRLKQELEYMKGPAREALAVRLRSAIQMGDLSENADYSAAKEEQGFLEGRIQELESILANVVIIDTVEKQADIVNIGDHVTVRDEAYGDEDTYFLVGPKEADPIQGKISYASPIGKALVGCRIGQTVQVETPGGSRRLKIVKIE